MVIGARLPLPGPVAIVLIGGLLVAGTVDAGIRHIFGWTHRGEFHGGGGVWGFVSVETGCDGWVRTTVMVDERDRHWTASTWSELKMDPIVLRVSDGQSTLKARCSPAWRGPPDPKAGEPSIGHPLGCQFAALETGLRTVPVEPFLLSAVEGPPAPCLAH